MDFVADGGKGPESSNPCFKET
ncbi:hypothetical protein CCACVL1_14633 [Corchorus capsularis]|uniref:Uncharacterized protein n=1 Tax=Corchorus capsularis TaxID=210143 RepID=A0A1R3I6C3_COCAP|nr:hypothetical protein CCACVL1_14633 [Corchorus capsularis]